MQYVVCVVQVVAAQALGPLGVAAAPHAARLAALVAGDFDKFEGKAAAGKLDKLTAAAAPYGVSNAVASSADSALRAAASASRVSESANQS